ncbi:zinc finger (CCCH type) motif-containing protein [Cardiosporidium cionae]|uniref:Zinc finger (CCCH type) motif-containing protein n=1 Tax=Cardiosporidium cionae TaxID=476202 RepID=A0ABQ7JBC1_9APIC|nr:zinc finger (CCCH type) motif-containing protein [Cardiosporidium cionae]|eukprot:KAF8821253.1 zinc finger (CCCH type) motif-containing protein [Cardiosporidium cionae]
MSNTNFITLPSFFYLVILHLKMERSGYRIASDARQGTHEEGKFPIICESCLGDNPYVRMVREPSGKECKICARPYTSFRWKPGPKARFKQTIVCQACSRLKNVCQTCLFDLEYGLPVQVRDKYLEEHQKLDLPDSHVSRNYLANQIDKMIEDLPYGKSASTHEALHKLARTQPYYKRNRPRVCTFWLRGTCMRGDECPFLHEEDEHDPQLADQNIRDRFSGQDDPVANKILRKATQSPSSQDITPPEDKSITTLYVGGLIASINEKVLRDQFYSFGEIQSIKMVPRQKCAFVTFSSRAAAEKAIESLHEDFSVKGESLRLTWSRPSGSLSSPSDLMHHGNTMKGKDGESLPGDVVGQYYHPMQQSPIYPYPMANLESSNPLSKSKNTPFPSPGSRDSNVYGNQGPHILYSSMNPTEAEHRK